MEGSKNEQNQECRDGKHSYGVWIIKHDTDHFYTQLKLIQYRKIHINPINYRSHICQNKPNLSHYR